MSPDDATSDEDAALLEAWREGDRDAGLALFGRYYQDIERFFVNKVASDDILDLVQQTFEGCVKSRDRIQDAGRFRSYLFGVAYNVLRMQYRRRNRQPTFVDLEMINTHEHGSGPASVVAAHEEQRLLLEALRHIPLSDQVLLELYYWEDLTTREIGDILRVPRNTVKGRLRAAHGRLEKMLDQLIASPTVLKSTKTNLAKWARGIAASLRRNESE